MLQDDDLKGRLSALEALVDWRKNGALLREHALSPFAKELASGVCRLHLRLSDALRRKVRKGTRTDFLCILEMGLYQMFFMDSVPARAAVDSCVELSRRIHLNENSVKFVNAVLRAVEREGLPKLPEQNVRRIALEYSLPEWIVRRLLDFGGTGYAENFARESVRRPCQWIRANLRRTTALDLQKELMLSGRIYKDRYLEIPEGKNEPRLNEILKSDAFYRGLFSVQNPAAEMVVEMLAVEDGMSVWDACAAPGGKSASIAESNPNAEILASDVSEERLRLVSDLTDRLQLPNVKARVADARSSDFNACFDRILLDVPCSNLGVLSRRPEVKYRLSPDDLKSLSELQFEILQNASVALKRGGILVYATCSPDTVETDKVVRRFLNCRGGFELHRPPVRTEGGALGLDRFYAAALRRIS